ncbi:MAG TPA: metalloregulator ArsR/SmtB family transcription factor [Miltoncostaeales bacterium]|nr:metalloregulator ArsR/SmtB family transcription factor [Miltoncostaeales bacterium]
MPLDYEITPSIHPVLPLIGGPSAPITLSGTMCSSCGGSGDLDAPIVDQIVNFWDDGYGVLTEITALAHTTDHIGDLTIEPFLERLLEPVVFDGPLPFETETDDERDAANARLNRLAGDGELRNRYVALLRVAWGVIEPTWQSEAIPRSLQAQTQWRERLDRGEDVMSLFPSTHIVRRQSQFGDMVRAANADGTLQVTPVLCSPHIIALPGLLSVSLRATDEDPIVARRKEADTTAKLLRPLADATRLTILSQLAALPSSVSDLARTLHIAQPTASVHLRQLREAGLVSVTREGSRTTYRVDQSALTGLLADVGRRLDEQVAQ